jgi:hypothetical protein
MLCGSLRGINGSAALPASDHLLALLAATAEAGQTLLNAIQLPFEKARLVFQCGPFTQLGAARPLLPEASSTTGIPA